VNAHSHRDTPANEVETSSSNDSDHRRKFWRTVNIGLGSLFLLVLASQAGDVIRIWFTVLDDAATALVPLLRIDAAATAWSLALGLGRIGLATFPSVILIRSAPAHRRIWLVPFVAMLVLVSSPFSLAACATLDRWLLLAFLSSATAALTRFRFVRWTVVLPFVVLWEIVPRHGLLAFADVGTREAAYRERLLAECGRRGGSRPQNLTADLLMPYHGINSLGDDLVLLTAEGSNDGGMRGRSGERRVGSWWLRRQDGGFQFELPSEATGNLWRGCVLDETIWMARANRIVGVKRLPEDGPLHEETYDLRLPSRDIDFGETACDADRGCIYVTEGTGGGMWEVPLDGRGVRRFALGGISLLPKRRFDGRLVVVNTASLIVFDPDEGRLLERVPAGFVNLGFDVCDTDGTVAIPDMMGRLRVFEMDGEGHYRFAWGVSLFAPRRVAYSRDCARIAVTSADDRRVFLVDASARRVVDVFRAGGALREVASTGPREFSVADVCSMTTYRW
jgi:hypothetical protein